MRKRRKIPRLDKIAIMKAVKKATEKELTVDVNGRTYHVRIVGSKAILPSGKVFEIPGEHIC